MWLEKNYFHNSFTKINNQYSTLSQKLKELKKKLEEKENNLKILKDLNQTKQIKKTEQKVIKIILPTNEIDYSKIIPKEDYNFLDENKIKNNNKNAKIKIIPSVTFDKEKKEIDTIKVNIKTKF